MSSYDHRITQDDLRTLEQDLADMLMEYPPPMNPRQKIRVRRITSILSNVRYHYMPHDCEEIVREDDTPPLEPTP